AGGSRRRFAALGSIAAITTAMPVAAAAITVSAFAWTRRCFGGARHAGFGCLDGGQRRLGAGGCRLTWLTLRARLSWRMTLARLARRTWLARRPGLPRRL